MAVVVRMPEVLAGVHEATIATWLVREGEEISVGTALAEVETEKAVVEYAAEVVGTVLRLLVEPGATTAVGDPIAVVGEPSEAVTTSAGAAAEPRATEPVQAAAPRLQTPSQVAAEPTSSEPGARLFASPLVRRLARERAIDLAEVTGTGPHGRIVRRDLEAHTAADVDSVSSATIRDVPLTPMRRAIARRLTESVTTVPHFYLEARCRVDQLLALRAQINTALPTRVSVTDLVLKAVAGALQEVPEANASWGGTVIHHHERADIALAVAIDGGLVTPVLRGVDQLTLTQISSSAGDLAERARAGRLRQQELDGGTFTVSNLGMYGVAAFSAIINPPHAGILAVGAARQEPVVSEGTVEVATVMTVTLSADHRVIDGAIGARWLAAFVRRVENPVALLL